MEQSAVNQAVTSGANNAVKDTKLHYMKVKNDRMAGTIAAYNTSDGEDTFKMALSDASDNQGNTTTSSSSAQDDHFGFFDFIDMINPLQHIPLLNIAYQKITGDTIKPISRIIGGTVFGGPAGAASGLITTVIEDGTGKSPLGNVMSIARGDERDRQAYNDLPPELLSFAEMPSVKNQNYSYNV